MDGEASETVEVVRGRWPRSWSVGGSRDPLADPAPLIRRVYRYVAFRIGDGADAEDVTSEVFERALRYRGSFDSSKGDIVEWLIGIARRAVAEHHATRAAAPGSLTEVELEAPGDMASENVQRLTLEAALSTLPERDRELIGLRYGAGLRAREIAEILGMQTHAVEVALSRAVARLRAAMGTAP
jgi:RNA polymerase sigma-70 factor (ECF subfamily)